MQISPELGFSLRANYVKTYKHETKPVQFHIKMVYFIINSVFLQPLKFEVKQIHVQGI